MRSKKKRVVLLCAFFFLCHPIKGFIKECIVDSSSWSFERLSSGHLDKADLEKYIQELIAALNTPEWEKAVEQLQEIGESAVGPLIDALGDFSGRSHKSYRAAIVLGKIGSPRAEEALIQALREEQTPNYVCRGIFRALCNIGSHKAERAIIEIVKNKDRDRFVRGSAADFLDYIESKKPGDTVVVTVLRGKEQTPTKVSVTLTASQSNRP